MALQHLLSTTNFDIWYDDAPGFGALPSALAIAATCEADLSRLAAMMGNQISIAFGETNRIRVNLWTPVTAGALGENRGYNSGGNTYMNLLPRPAASAPDQAIRIVFVAELAEILNSQLFQSGRGGFPESVSGSAGTSITEGVSHVMTAELYPAAFYTTFGDTDPAHNPIGMFGPTVNAWINTRADPVVANLVDKTGPGEITDQATGCAILFLNYLHYQRNKSWQEIFSCGAAKLADTFLALMGSNSGWEEFTALLEKHLPQAFGPYTLKADNIFPLLDAASRTAALSFVAIPVGPTRVLGNGSVALHLCKAVKARDYAYDVLAQDHQLSLTVKTYGFASPSASLVIGGNVVSVYQQVDCAVTVGQQDPSRLWSYTLSPGTVQLTINKYESMFDVANGWTFTFDMSIVGNPGRVWLDAWVNVYETFESPQEATRIKDTVVFDAAYLKFEDAFNTDTNLCVIERSRFVQHVSIPIWKTLPDPPPDSWIEAVRWLDAMRTELTHLEKAHPETAQALTWLFAERFGVNPEMLGPKR